jgi:hypothetical protein
MIDLAGSSGVESCTATEVLADRRQFTGEGREQSLSVVRERLANGRVVMPVRERLEQMLLAVIVEVYRPPRPDVLEVENGAERPGLALQELHDLVPGRPRDRDVLASNAHEQMGTAQLFPRHYSQPSRGHCC